MTAASLAGKTLFISGGSRGIGKAIALRAARDGANIVIAAKTDQPNPKLPGTIHTTAEAIVAARGKALPIACDIRFEDQVAAAVAQTVATFGGIDILVNNASAISLTDTLATPMKRFDLMLDVNLRGTYVCSQACIPHLKQAANPHILTLAPPLNMQVRWFAPHLAYTISKYGMAMCVLGLAEEFRAAGIGVNALWPRFLIATDALNVIPGIDTARCRRPDIVADAAHAILTRSARDTTGHFFGDEEALAMNGVTDFTAYAIDPTQADNLHQDLFV
jgi:citronellol/citronellal dehydrogenase